MSWSETYKVGFAKIICDTSTMSVGDTIRVRSMTDSSLVMNKQVVTVGTPVIFDVGFIKDYVKICMVQDIGGTPTEIGGVYRTLDYGQTLYINVLDKTTLGGIQGILNAHQENDLLAIGDEVTIKVNGADWVMQIAGMDIYDSHEIIFVSKIIYSKSLFYSTSLADPSYADSIPRTQMQSFYNSIAESDRQFIKQMEKSCLQCRRNNSTKTWISYSDYIWLPNEYEVNGTEQDSTMPKTQFPIFTTQGNRIKKYNGVADGWWTSDGVVGSNTYAYAKIVTSSGIIQTQGVDNQFCNLPCFHLVADS